MFILNASVVAGTMMSVKFLTIATAAGFSSLPVISPEMGWVNPTVLRDSCRAEKYGVEACSAQA